MKAIDIERSVVQLVGGEEIQADIIIGADGMYVSGSKPCFLP